jgi:hypothetical protein
VHHLGGWIARVPALQSVPDFNLDEELAAATNFLVEGAVPAGTKNAAKAKPVPMGRTELSALALNSPGGGVAVHDDHDDE